MNPEPPSAYEQLSPDAAARVDAVCDRFEKAWRAARSGAVPPCLADFLEGCAEPERTVLAAELRAIDRAYRRHDAAVAPTNGARKPGAAGEDHVPTRPRPAGPPPARWPTITGLELLEVLGSGGMGIVFKARQPTLDREVAVKFLRDAHLADTDQRERFKQEARAVARLQHPALVQLYEFGEVPSVDGPGSEPYLVLEYVSGGSLAQRLRGSRLPPREAARLVETLAEAIHYAHRQGVIHRDLKPANVLFRTEGRGLRTEEKPLSPQSSVLSPVVSDFGLAKFVAGGSLTQTGTVLGTPCYMAPEQAVGNSQAITPAVDVYGLGAILYEALTGRPPFEALTDAATVRQVQEEEPTAPRQLTPVVPRDLETICLKCLRKDPVRRYASAQELADDLRRFRCGEPIRARPVGTAERVLVWCRRKPVIAGLVTALALVCVAGVAGVLWQSHLARQRQAEAKREQERADENLKKLREKIDRLGALGRDLARDPRLRKAALAVLEEALDFYQEILPQQALDPRLRREAARLYGEVAHTYHSAGKWRHASDAFRREAELLSALAADEPANAEHNLRLGVSYRRRGNVLRDLGERQEARAAYEHAIEIQERALDQSRADPARQMALANSLYNLSSVLSTQSEADEIERHYRRAVRLDRAAVAADPKRELYQSELALGLEGLGLLMLVRGKFHEASAAIAEALEINKKLVQIPTQRDYIERYLARNYTSQGRVLAALGQVEAADRAFKEAVALLSPALEQGRGDPFHRMDLARALLARADFLKQTSRKNEVEGLLRQVIGHYKVLRKNFAQNKEISRLLATTYLALVSWLWELGRSADAAEPYRLACELAPDDPEVSNRLAWFLATCAEPRLRKPAQAVRLARKAVDASPKAGPFWNTLGAAHYHNGDAKAAVAALEKSMRLRAGGDSYDWFFVAMAHHRLGDHAKARGWFERAVGWMTKYMPHDDELRRFRAEAEALLK
jgi:tetratricopeptide (TPR) repeat protein/tRNA A-37 threonylcarbamoyl transferase component Bud32